MTKRQIGPYMMLFAYVSAGIVLIIGLSLIAIRTGVTYLIDRALEAE